MLQSPKVVGDELGLPSIAGVFNVFPAKDPQTDGEMERGPPTYILYKIVFHIKLSFLIEGAGGEKLSPSDQKCPCKRG